MQTLGCAACAGALKSVEAYAEVLVNREQAVIDVFEQSTRSVVNVFDVTLQVRFFHLSDLKI